MFAETLGKDILCAVRALCTCQSDTDRTDAFLLLKTTWPIEIKFHMTNPYDWFIAKIYTNCNGHMTKMATMPIYG